MAGYFPIGSNFPEFPGRTHDSGKHCSSDRLWVRLWVVGGTGLVRP